MNAALAGGIILDPRTGHPTIPYEAPRLVLPSIREALRGVGIVLAGFSDAVEKKVIDHITGKSSYTSPAPLYLALTTVAVLDSDTSATITEATYTGYARLQIPAVDWNAASGTTAAATNANQKLFASCNGGSSTIIGWALSPVSTTAGAGDITFFGTCSSTVISTTQTPATVNAGALSVSVD